MKRTIAAALAVAAVTLAPAARAQMASPIHVGVSGGVTVPVGNVAEGNEISFKSKSGYNVNGHLAFSLPMLPVGLRADVGYNALDGKPQFLYGTDGRFNLRVFSGTLNVVLQTPGMIVAKPYLIGGVGAYNVKHEGIASAAGESDKFADTQTNFGLNGGAGIKFGLGGLSAFAEARYHYVFDKDVSDACANSEGACIPHKATTFVPISFGIMF